MGAWKVNEHPSKNADDVHLCPNMSFPVKKRRSWIVSYSVYIYIFKCLIIVYSKNNDEHSDDGDDGDNDDDDNDDNSWIHIHMYMKCT